MFRDGAAPFSAAVVLVVEQNQQKRMATAAALRKEGFEVYEAADGAEALKVLDTVAIDVLFTDIDMEGGTALSQWVEQHRPSTYVVWTADGERDQAISLH